MADASRLGSTIFSLGGEGYKRLKDFKTSLETSSRPLYFAKVDVKAAFDTIPQDAVLALMAMIPTKSKYRISKHQEFKPGDRHLEDSTWSKPTRKFPAVARPTSDSTTFTDALETRLAVGRKNTIFIENMAAQFKHKDDLLALLREHVENNLVKIGKKFYRQKAGIPQGSVLSALLCNYFYADLEAQHLSFLDPSTSLLLRLTDDFLLITTERSHAKQFLQVMHDGLPAYGVNVNPDKTLVNFEVTINERKVPRLVGPTREFPYCGSLIDTKTLNMSKGRERKGDSGRFSILNAWDAMLANQPRYSYCRFFDSGVFQDTRKDISPESVK